MNNEYIDNFTSKIPLEKLDILLELGNEFSFDPQESCESEKYFIDLLEKYSENFCDLEDLKQFLRQIVMRDFQIICQKPNWIQGSEWPFTRNGKPMIFIGQIECKKEKINLHDDAIFYVFWDRDTGDIKTIMQIF